MRHKYATRGIVLGRTGIGEANALVSVLTEDVGLVYARAQSLRRSGARLSATLQTLNECDLALVRGKEGWRLTGAVLVTPWFQILSAAARTRAGRGVGLMERLAPREAPDTSLFSVLQALLVAFEREEEEHYDALELLAALHVLSVLGLQADAPPDLFSKTAIQEVSENRAVMLTRINKGIAESGL